MSVFDEIMCKLSEISNRYVSSLNDDLKVAFDCLDKFAEEYQKEREKRQTTQKNNKNLMNTLQSINEDEDESSPKEGRKSKDGEKRLSNKRSKQEVDGMSSPEQEKRQKRNASVKAQNNITKQNLQALRILNRNIILLSDEEDGMVNVSLTQKLRREDSVAKTSRRRKEDEKENAEPALVQVKQEKISLPPETMETEAALDMQVKQEPNKDDFAMPPPAAPVPKPRKMLPKDKSTDSEEEQSGKRTRTRTQADKAQPPAADRQTDSEDELPGARRTRTRKQPEAAPPAGERATRASRRATKQAEPSEAPLPEPRPKRTRAKKKASESSATENENPPPQEIGSPASNPRPKRTRRGKAAEKEAQKPKDPEPEIITPKEERVSVNPQSPAIPMKTTKKKNEDPSSEDPESQPDSRKDVNLEETHVLCPMDATVTIAMDKTVVLTNGVYDHTDGDKKIMNSTVVLEKLSRETLVLDKPAPIMDATVVIEKGAAQKDGTPNITDDLSVLTDDNSEDYITPPKDAPPPEPTSAVKAKVQQFEEMAARTTRTKTRAMAKKESVAEENCTPPDKISKQVLSADTLAKMNNLIFNGKPAQVSSSATKPTAKLPPVKAVPASASKAGDRDDARRKKEAMLEAKKELQRRKREEKMAAAAAAREAAEKERRAAMQAAARDRLEKQLHADQGKIERMKEVEKKKQELARKVAETEERRRAEEAARHARLADEQRKAELARRRQLEDSEAMKKEAALMAKEIEKRQREYLEKQKMKQRMEADKMHTPRKAAGTPRAAGPPAEPVYMSDGFQYLNSDEDDDEAPKVPTPPWCGSKARHRQLALQQLLPTSTVDRFFSVRVHCPDLRAIFPALERRELKRTSSAVWRTPPTLQLPRIQESPV